MKKGLTRFPKKTGCPEIADYFHVDKLVATAGIVCVNLNKIIDQNYYPVEEARTSNLRHRPIGIGVQGLADVFQLLRIPYACDTAQHLNQIIFEAIYFGALQASMRLSQKDGPYQSFSGSPISKGILQQDMWSPPPRFPLIQDWNELRALIKESGVRNSLLVAPMPTASTAQILGNTEGFEPLTQNIFTRKVSAGSFVVINKHMLEHLTDLGLWNDSTRRALIAHEGSLQNIPNIPDEIKEIYKTVWEESHKVLINMAADRGRFIDQSQSFNFHLAQADDKKIISAFVYAWKSGLKTGMYYFRTKAAAEAIPVTTFDTLPADSICENCQG